MEPKNWSIMERQGMLGQPPKYHEDGTALTPSEVGLDIGYALISVEQVFLQRAELVHDAGLEIAHMIGKECGWDEILKAYCLYYIWCPALDAICAGLRKEIKTCCLDHCIESCIAYGIDPFTAVGPKRPEYEEMVKKYSTKVQSN